MDIYTHIYTYTVFLSKAIIMKCLAINFQFKKYFCNSVHSYNRKLALLLIL